MLKATNLTRVSQGIYKLDFASREVKVERTKEGWTATAAWNPNLKVGPYKQKRRAANKATEMLEARIQAELSGKVTNIEKAREAKASKAAGVKRGRGRPRKEQSAAVH